MRIYTKLQDGQELRVAEEMLADGNIYVAADRMSAGTESEFKLFARKGFLRRGPRFTNRVTLPDLKKRRITDMDYIDN